MATVNRKQVQQTIQNLVHMIMVDIENGHISPDCVPAVIVGRMSARKWFVGWNCQVKAANPGDIATVPHREGFIENPHIHAILKDGLWHTLLFS
jgi:hypothetical protein